MTSVNFELKSVGNKIYGEILWLNFFAFIWELQIEVSGTSHSVTIALLSKLFHSLPIKSEQEEFKIV